MSDSVRPHRRQPTRLPRPWDSPGKNTGVGSHFLLQCMKVKSESEVAQSCPTFHNPMDCSPPGSSLHGIFQARVLEWGALSQDLFFLPFFCSLLSSLSLENYPNFRLWMIYHLNQFDHCETFSGRKNIIICRVGHDWGTSLSLFTFVHWRRKWQPTPVFLPGESRGRGSLVDCRLWGRTESDTTEAT